MKGEGGQKYPKLWPRGLWMTPKVKDPSHQNILNGVYFEDILDINGCLNRNNDPIEDRWLFLDTIRLLLTTKAKY